jgi:hypothetical protein
MTRRDAAHFLGFSEETLAMWALSKKGPPACAWAGGAGTTSAISMDSFSLPALPRGRRMSARARGFIEAWHLRAETWELLYRSKQVARICPE